MDNRKAVWNSCLFCKHLKFTQLHDFTRHLRSEHCTVEGGSFICRYGYNSVCNSLPMEGVSDHDYAQHIMKHHAFAAHNAESARRKQSTCSDKSVTSLGNESSTWLAVASSQNLAGVLNDPGRGKQRDFFTKLWGVDFVETSAANVEANPNLALVTRAHFESYLRKIAKRHRRHEHIRSDTHKNDGQRRRTRHADPLDIPPIFLLSDFDLSNPDTFYTAVPFARAGITVDGAFRNNSKMLQEKLAQGLDQVEMRIAEQVADKSEGFFAAMTSHDTLMTQLSKMVAVVRDLRGRLGHLDSVVAHQAMHALRLYHRRANHLRLLQKLKLMRTVHQTQPQIQILLSAPDYVAALELMSTSLDIVTHQLDSVHCFRHLGPQLTEIGRLIDKMMANEFESYSTKDLNRPLTDDLDVLEQEKLVCIMLGMLRRGCRVFILQYQEESFTAIRALVKQLVLEALADSDCETHGAVNERVQSLPLAGFLNLMEVVTKQLARLLRKIKGVHDVMRDTIEMSAGGRSDSFSFLSTRDRDLGIGELQKLLNAVCSFAHEECAKLLTNIALDTASGTQVCRLGQVVENFCSDCAELAGRGPAALKAAFQSAAGRFIQKFHNDKKDKLNVALDGDSWRPTEVPAAVQGVITALAEERGFEASVEAKGKSEAFLMAGSEKYFIVGSAVTLIRLIQEYAILSQELPLLSWSLQRNVAELLTLYNSRSCQLVLGGRALLTRTGAGPKSITTTNLVLTSRVLQLIQWLLPNVRRHFEGVITEQKNGKPHSMFEEVDKNMTDHIEQLHKKVVFIATSAVADHVSQWTAKPPVPSQSFQRISRDLTKLHEAVSAILPASQIEILYRKINDKFKASMREQIRKLNIVNNGGPQHGTVTGELIFYVEMLKKINVLPSEELSDSSLADMWPHRPNT